MMKQAIRKVVDLENESAADSVHYSNLRKMSGSYHGIVYHDNDYYEAEESVNKEALEVEKYFEKNAITHQVLYKESFPLTKIEIGKIPADGEDIEIISTRDTGVFAYSSSTGYIEINLDNLSIKEILFSSDIPVDEQINLLVRDKILTKEEIIRSYEEGTNLSFVDNGVMHNVKKIPGVSIGQHHLHCIGEKVYFFIDFLVHTVFLFEGEYYGIAEGCDYSFNERENTRIIHLASCETVMSFDEKKESVIYHNGKLFYLECRSLHASSLQRKSSD
jgi:hypothetical protein